MRLDTLNIIFPKEHSLKELFLDCPDTLVLSFYLTLKFMLPNGEVYKDVESHFKYSGLFLSWSSCSLRRNE